MRKIIFSLFSLLIFAQISYGQDALDKKLMQLQAILNKNFNDDKLLFDRYNCILFYGKDVEIKMTHIKIRYRDTNIEEDAPHSVNIDCIDSTTYNTYTKKWIYLRDGCVSINGKTTFEGSEYPMSGYGFGFRQKAEAINFLNLFNEFLDTAKKMGFCLK